MSAVNKRHRICEICGVRERHSAEKLFFARFPLDENRCKAWLRVIGKHDLVHLPIEKLHDLKYVCGSHFNKRDFTKTRTRLKKRAIPKLNLTATPLTEDCFAEFPLHVAKNNPIPSTSAQPIDATVAMVSSSQTNYDPIPSTSTQQVDTDLMSNVECISTTLPVEAMASSSRAIYDPIPSTSSERVDTEIISNVTGIYSSKPKRRKILEVVQTPNTVVTPASMSTTQGPSLNTQDPAEQGKTPQAKTKDFGLQEKELLEQLIKARSTIKSLKKNAKLIDNIQSPLLKEILIMALKNQKRKPRGRRWSTKCKISLLAIHKRSPKAYRYLQHLMPLPSVNTLQNILKKVPMEPGICLQALQYLKKQHQAASSSADKYCCLLFDEISLKPRAIYNNATDKVEGYVDVGSGERSKDLADHALVFMLQGIRKKYKQPIAFYFVKGTISSAKLATLIMKIIREVINTGYHVMATVCDQGPTNMGAINILKQMTPNKEENSTENNFFKIDDHTIYIVYDVPHLMKSIRNNFLNYGFMRMDNKTAKWEHLMKVEEKNRNLLYLSKISQTHVQPKYRAKMKVKYAAQILSNTVAAVLKLMALAEKDPVESNQMMETGVIVQQLDKLFDYTNGPSGPDDTKKGLRVNVSAKSDHIQVWAEYRKILNTVQFVKPQTGTRAKNVRCIQGYITTLCSLRDIWSECHNSLGFKYLNLRQLNQDSLENLFGILRQHSPTNKHPTVSSFIAGMKTTIISKMTAPHSKGSNCQKDFNNLLTDFHDLVFEKEDCTEIDAEKENIHVDDNKISYPQLSIEEAMDAINNIDEEIEKDLINIDTQPVVYLSGYIVHCIFNKHDCVACSASLLTKDPIEPIYEYIKLREWWQNKRCLTYPSINMCRYVKDNVNAFEKNIMTSMHLLNIRALTITVFMANSDASFLKCSAHHDIITNRILSRLALILIRRQCERINKMISAEEENIKDIQKKAEQKGVDKNVF